MSTFAARLPHAVHSLRPAFSTTIALRSSMPQCAISSPSQLRQERLQRNPSRNDTTRGAAAAVRCSFEDFFIHSLVAASSCHRHRPSWAPMSSPRRIKSTAHRQRHHARHHQSRCFSSRSPEKQEAIAVAPRPDVSKEQYAKLVDTYPSFGLDQPEWDFETGLKRDPRQKEHYPLAPRLVLGPEKELDTRRKQWKPLPPENEEHARQMSRFRRRLGHQLGRVSLDKLWADYQALLTPRPRYLNLDTIQRLFRHLAWVNWRDLDSMQRYFAFLNECIGEEVPLTADIWNTAIVFAGRWLRNATSKEVKGAVETWMRMEQSGHQANHVTFNILFQVAVRAGRFALADTIFNELKARGMPLDRYFRASLIYYAGARRDGEGVRQAFRELVNAGEIVDTGVMNTVLLSFFRAGEASAAEHTFYKMKYLHEQKFGTGAPSEWQSKKELTALLNKTGMALREEKRLHETSFFGAQFSTDEKREEVQRASPIAPDDLTYRIIIRYHAYTSGDIDRIRELLAEMQLRGLHVHGSVYVHLLRAFHIHGGYAFSKWNRSSLEDLWSEMLTASAPTVKPTKHIQNEDDNNCDMPGAMMAKGPACNEIAADTATEDDEPPPVPELERPTYFTKSLALSAVHAFYKCTGKERMLEVWYEILMRWKDVSGEDKTLVQDTVKRLAAEDSMYV